MLPALLVLLAVSKIAPDQVGDSNSVRIECNCDLRPGTLVNSNQIGDGRTKEIVDGLPTVCIVIFFRADLPEIPSYKGQGFKTKGCYTQAGLALLLSDPNWLAWWNSQP